MKILIVDDNPVNRTLLAMILAKTPHRVLEAQNGYEAVAMSMEETPGIVFMDIHMPGMDGVESARRIKSEKGKEIRIIAVSADPSMREAVLASGHFEQWISKPFDWRDIIGSLEEPVEEAPPASTDAAVPDRLVRSALHDMATPLGVIMNALEMQMMEHGETEYTRMAAGACRTLRHLQDDFRDALFYDPGQFRPEMLELDGKMRGQLEYFRQSFVGRRIVLASELASCRVEFDTVLLKRLLDDLIALAVRHTPAGGEVAVTLNGKGRLTMVFPVESAHTVEDIVAEVNEKETMHQGMGIQMIRRIGWDHGVACRAEGLEKQVRLTLDFGALLVA